MVCMVFKGCEKLGKLFQHKNLQMNPTFVVGTDYIQYMEGFL